MFNYIFHITYCLNPYNMNGKQISVFAKETYFSGKNILKLDSHLIPGIYLLST